MVNILALVFVRLFNVFRRNKTNVTRAFAALRVNHLNFLKEKLCERLYIHNQRTKQAHYSFICPPFNDQNHQIFCFSYGDRCPKSISGRLFAIVWILTGICMCSIFTAMLTTALTTISLDSEITLPRAKVSRDGSYMSTKANHFNPLFDSKEACCLSMYYSFDVVAINTTFKVETEKF